MSRVRNIVALVLLAAWPVMTSHALLQHWGVIHVVHVDHDSGDGSHEHETDNHAFADGGYLKGSSSIQVTKPLSSVVRTPLSTAALLAPVFALQREVRPCGPSPPGAAPPEFSNRWQFSFRAALPVRAPSFAS
ncbi:MAG: hypothetical protein L0Z50_03090 [Verrucomicrobiales bacterium]|nr:hypothetical protein [Verrucomicrobiales bacterium]